MVGIVIGNIFVEITQIYIISLYREIKEHDDKIRKSNEVFLFFLRDSGKTKEEWEETIFKYIMTKIFWNE